MRLRSIAPIAIVLFTTACGSPSEPGGTNLTGRWTGTFVVSDCTRIGGVSSSCPSWTLPGTSFGAAALFTETERSSVAGYAAYGGNAKDFFLSLRRNRDFFYQFRAQLQPDGRLQFSSGAGAPPTTVEKLSWELKLVGTDRLEGTLLARHSFYKEPGETVVNGTVVLQRE